MSKTNFKGSKAQLEAAIRANGYPDDTSAILRRTFETLSKQLPAAMAIPEVAVAITSSVIFSGPENRAELIDAGAEMAQTRGRMVLSILWTLAGRKDLAAMMEDIEREIVRMALDSTKSKGAAAKMLGCPQSTLSTKIKRFGLRE